MKKDNGVTISDPVEIILDSAYVLNPDTAEYSADAADSHTAALPAEKKAKTRAFCTAKPANEDDPELKTYDIVINYVFESGAPAADSYIASIAEGTGFSAVVVSPNVVGYSPDHFQVEINVTDIRKDQVYRVVYKPKTVGYIVHHYQQNILNDNYVIFKTEKLEGKVGTLTEVEAKSDEDMPGFWSLPFQNIEIAADGSTVVDIFYDRLYYLMAFKLDGGYGAEPIYARFGSPVTVPEPVRPGYSFAGWKCPAASGRRSPC